ncbi:MAG TPA: DoxX family membrane protein [Myxococcota bacterium]|nr:DoxX family membrane protein [Myxococcota bacterium]
MNKSRAKRVLQWGLTLFMVGSGINHFWAPGAYVAMMPAILPWPLGLVYVSGAFEILGGLGLILRATRRPAAVGLIALLLAVFPANVNMAVNHLPLAGHVLPAWALWARLPFQALFIVWAAWYARPPRKPAPQLLDKR